MSRLFCLSRSSTDTIFPLQSLLHSANQNGASRTVVPCGSPCGVDGQTFQPIHVSRGNQLLQRHKGVIVNAWGEIPSRLILKIKFGHAGTSCNNRKPSDDKIYPPQMLGSYDVLDGLVIIQQHFAFLLTSDWPFCWLWGGLIRISEMMKLISQEDTELSLIL